MIDKNNLAATLRGRFHADCTGMAAGILAEVEEYEGWTNQETWAVRLHLSNTAAWAAEARRIATYDNYTPALSEFEGWPEEERARAIASLKAKFREGLMAEYAGRTMGYNPARPTYTDSAAMLGDCLAVFMARVDWREVVEHFAEAAQ